MSQIVDYDDSGLEKLNVHARQQRPLLRVEQMDENIDLTDV